MIQTSNDQFNNQLGTRLRETRETSGLSQSELAELVGKETRVIVDMETGKRAVTATELWDLCTALNSKPFEFFI